MLLVITKGDEEVTRLDNIVDFEIMPDATGGIIFARIWHEEEGKAITHLLDFDQEVGQKYTITEG